jgi:hypothetical protein
MPESNMYPIEERFSEFCNDFKEKGKFGRLKYKDFIHTFKNVCHQYDKETYQTNFFGRGFIDKLHGKVYYEENTGVVITLETIRRNRIKVRLVIDYIPMQGSVIIVQIKVPGSEQWTSINTIPSKLSRVIDALYD